MKIEKIKKLMSTQVCSLDVAKELKKLGIEGESIFAYFDNFFKDEWEIYPFINKIGIRAYTTSELGEILPSFVNGLPLVIVKQPKYWFIRYGFHENEIPESPNEQIVESNLAEAMAKMLIYLIENNFMEFP
jgi:hypothetical protein